MQLEILSRVGMTIADNFNKTGVCKPVDAGSRLENIQRFFVFERFCFENSEKWFALAKPLSGVMKRVMMTRQLVSRLVKTF